MFDVKSDGRIAFHVKHGRFFLIKVLVISWIFWIANIFPVLEQNSSTCNNQYQNNTESVLDAAIFFQTVWVFFRNSRYFPLVIT